MLTPLASKNNPVLAGLLSETARLQKELPGWVTGHLLPALAAFRPDATDAGIATALANLHQVLRMRAIDDPWLGDLANLGTGEYAFDPRAMTSPGKLGNRVELPPDRLKNRTVVEQARQLVEALTRTTTQGENGRGPAQPQAGAK